MLTINLVLLLGVVTRPRALAGDGQQSNDSRLSSRSRQQLRDPVDPQLASSQYQLARVYQQEGNSTRALVEVDSLLRTVPDNSSAHYLRGQILARLGRTEEAKAEMRQANEISNTARAKRQQELEGGVADPQLMEQTAP